MSCTGETLSKLAGPIEAELRPLLGGLFGGFVRAYLPQAWVFRTEQDAASLVVDPQGKASVTPSALPTPDVTVELPHGELGKLLAAGRPRGAPPASVRVTAHTAKGRAALQYLAPRLGL